jgi:hypothetical protein
MKHKTVKALWTLVVLIGVIAMLAFTVAPMFR